MKIGLVIVLSYLLGNISTGFLLGKWLRKTDIREFGSKNAGATNALRVFGVKIGLMTLAGDMLKGFLATRIGFALGGELVMAIAALSVVIGHNYPVFLKFKGGKGIATTAGVLLALSPILLLVQVGIMALIVWVTKYVSLGSVVNAILLPILIAIFYRPFSGTLVAATVLMGLMAVFRHRANIVRLINGTERKLGEKV
ncbi:glycerol-3-phosphate 1-O-acyltransferase PlsY [Gottschalkiaceae bacterium SANA]|nr:glycerol-3-phosphate 1-O-acyltransferase PlsY [Gottschalkiaceae bacterium SANA]